MVAKQSSQGEFAGVELEFRFRDNIKNREIHIGPKEIPLGKMYRFSTDSIDPHIAEQIDIDVIDDLGFVPAEPGQEDSSGDGEPKILIFYDGEVFRSWPVSELGGDENPTVNFFVDRDKDGLLIIECTSILYRNMTSN